MTQHFDTPELSTSTFVDLNLSSGILKIIQDELGYSAPSPIQQQTIPSLLQGFDLIGQAQTGTGKTAAFAIPAIEQLDPAQRKPQVLVLAPTRELAIQVAEQFKILSAHKKNVSTVVLCGGQDYTPQLRALRDGAQIVVGAPGRVLDHLKRGTLNLSELRTLVLDEADEMLRMGFIEDVETIIAKTPEQRQIALFSATMPKEIRQIANRYLRDPVSVVIKSETATVKSIEQRFMFASQPQKPQALLRVLATEEAQGVIVFTRTKTSTDEVATLLQQSGHRAMAIHGDISQALRERVISQFKQGLIDVLVATDVAARGLDVDRVTHVINYDMAHDCETYVHRIGRTGRAGRSGVAILFITPREARLLNALERHTKQRIVKFQVPNDAAILQAQQTRFVRDLQRRLQHPLLNEYKQLMEQIIEENQLDTLDAAAALALGLNQDKSWKRPAFIDKMKNNEFDHQSSSKSTKPQRPINKKRNERSRDDSADFNSSYQEELFRIDVGRIHGVKPANIVGAIANEAGIQSRFITGLRINDDHSMVRLPSGLSKDVFQGLSKAWVCGRQLRLTSMGLQR